MSDVPLPGSKDALELGCICPVMDNHYGDPKHARKFGSWQMQDCPVHNPAHTKESNANARS